MSASYETVKVGIVSVSDRASTGVYVDQGLPALKDWLARALKNPITFESRLTYRPWVPFPVGINPILVKLSGSMRCTPFDIMSAI